jgi:hypothetical protein
MKLFKVTQIVIGLLFFTNQSIGQSTEPMAIELIHMGGSDCPPCENWRRFELPKLEKTEVFKSIKFSYVIKSIKSSVPSAIFLPSDVKAHKEKLDEAGGGNTGAPQAALLVNGLVYDYWFGARDATLIEQMLIAARDASKYPVNRCKRRNKGWTCAEKA